MERTIQVFTEGDVSLRLQERVFGMTPEHAALRHKYVLSWNGRKAIAMDHEDITELARVLIDAMECAKERSERFYSEEASTV